MDEFDYPAVLITAWARRDILLNRLLLASHHKAVKKKGASVIDLDFSVYHCTGPIKDEGLVQESMFTEVKKVT